MGNAMTIDFDDRYANAAYIQNADAFITRWTKTATEFRDAALARGAAELDVPYGGSDRQCYDLFEPEQPARGTMIFVHGGYWLRFDKSFWSHLAQGALDRGWRVVMPSYDLCPTVSIAQITQQISQLTQQIAARFSGPLSLTGHSAGGHLVARMGQVLPADITARIAHIVPISPVGDLRELIHTKMNDDFALTPDTAASESPLLHPAPSVRVTVLVGGDERPVFLEQARAFGPQWGAQVMIADQRHHFDVIDALCDPNSDVTKALTHIG